MRRHCLAAVVACSVLLIGLPVGCNRCGTQSLGTEYEVRKTQPENAEAISNRVLLVADNQLHHLYGGPLWIRSEFTTQLVSVAIRPLQQDFFGHSVLTWILKNFAKEGLTPVIHLGDAMDVGCSGEFDRFVEIMTEALATGSVNNPPQPWVMAPGNHDAFLLGNTHEGMSTWQEACKRGGQPLTKDLFVERYLKALIDQPANSGLRESVAWPPPARGSWQSEQQGEDFLVAVSWNVDKERPYRSHIVQLVNLSLPPPPDGEAPPPVFAVIFDSSQYNNRPILLPSFNAGVNGNMMPDQIATVEAWLSQGPEKRLNFLMSHHPYSTLYEGAQQAVDDFRRRYKIPLYNSAHTHRGEWMLNQSDNTWLELNLGSALDWPIEFRTLSLHQNEPLKEQGRFAVRSKLFRIPDFWQSPEGFDKPVALEGWEAQEGDDDFFVSYQDLKSPDPKKTLDNLAKVLLSAHRRMIRLIPTRETPQWPPDTDSDEAVLARIEEVLQAELDEKLDFLVALDAFDRQRKAEDEVQHRDYRLWQAVWASKYDSLKGRRPAVDDTFVIVPWSKGEQ